jgi:hypothetical protein
MQGLPHIVELEWLDDRCDQFHGYSSQNGIWVTPL